VAQRAVLPSTADEALDAYATAVMNRRQPSEPTPRKNIHYARKGVGLIKAGSLDLATINPAMVRLMVETMAGSHGERHLVFRGLVRFLNANRAHSATACRSPNSRLPSGLYSSAC
jgi:hypothetical protein